ncbi:MAG TPA: lysyl oxidase family protein [Acidimicrobiales bacterium]|nr:lysyl oxidase family protein [Acidimicrobiales bacterium]
MRLFASAVAVLAAALAVPVHADEPVPSSCGLHPVHVVRPGCVPALTSEVREPGITLPNLVPNVADAYIVGFQGVTPTMFFDTHAQNLGAVPLQLSFSGIENPETFKASQCVSWTAGRVCRDQREVGGFSWHEPHAHFHYNGFADYQLRRLAPDGRPDYSDAGLVARSEKVSFCLMDSRKVGSAGSPAPFYLTCTPTVVGISPGWTDVYAPTQPGQQLPLGGVTDGRYALIVSVDYANRLYETDDTDNVVEVTIDISNGVRDLAIVGHHYP